MKGIKWEKGEKVKKKSKENGRWWIPKKHLDATWMEAWGWGWGGGKDMGRRVGIESQKKK